MRACDQGFFGWQSRGSRAQCGVIFFFAQSAHNNSHRGSEEGGNKGGGGKNVLRQPSLERDWQLIFGQTEKGRERARK
jgi:hypothetical protein